MSPSRPNRRRVTAVACCVLFLVAASCATSPSGGGGPAPTSCPAKGAGQIQVAVVVDMTAFGAAPNSTCVVVASGSNGMAALAARAQLIGAPPPRYAANGLLCAIDGIPLAPACGQNGPDGPEYWAYYLGGASWTYSTVGPGLRGLTDGAVDGWRFIAGGANQPPDMPSSFVDLTT
ncbi:MAG TPA: hypothetical protein VJM33_02245 [Microthrixaceae bacterium]|nr:hypothetical protein [Microthrixaceae bacterium]